MKLKDFSSEIEDYNKYSQITDFEHFLNVYYDDVHKKFKFNLNNSVYFDIPDKQYSYITVHADLHWPIISYNLYNTTRLAWLLMKVNNVKPEHVFNYVRAGTVIKYIPYETVQTIIKSYY